MSLTLTRGVATHRLTRPSPGVWKEPAATDVTWALLPHHSTSRGDRTTITLTHCQMAHFQRELDRTHRMDTGGGGKNGWLLLTKGTVPVTFTFSGFHPARRASHESSVETTRGHKGDGSGHFHFHRIPSSAARQPRILRWASASSLSRVRFSRHETALVRVSRMMATSR